MTNVAGSILPLVTEGTAGDLLGKADLFTYKSLPFLKYMLNDNFEDAYSDAMAGQARATNAACFETTNLNPVPYLVNLTHKFPLLALYHTGGAVQKHTTHKLVDIRKYKLLYVLPQLTYDSMKRIQPILSLVPMLIESWLSKGNDSGWDSGQYIFDTMDSVRISVEGYEIGFADWSERDAASFFPCVEMDLMVGMLQGHDSLGLPNFQGVLASVDIGDEDDGNYRDLVIIDTEVAEEDYEDD